MTVRDRLSGSDGVWDLDVPTDLPAERLVEILQSAVGAQRRPGDERLVTRVVLRLIRPDEPAVELGASQSLADVGAWDGSVLELAGVREEREPPKVGPVQKWESLLDNLAVVDEVTASVGGDENASRSSERGFVKKRVD